MTITNRGGTRPSDDPYHLRRFLPAQDRDYDTALAELVGGQKRTHWMWYIFPQMEGLGFSPTSRLYAIKSIEEAKAYLEHPILGPRLLECAEAVLRIEGRSANEIFGDDEVKLKSCATLFACASPAGSVFDQLLAKYFRGWPDDRTLRLLGLR